VRRAALKSLKAMVNSWLSDGKNRLACAARAIFAQLSIA